MLDFTSNLAGARHQTGNSHIGGDVFILLHHEELPPDYCAVSDKNKARHDATNYPSLSLAEPSRRGIATVDIAGLSRRPSSWGLTGKLPRSVMAGCDCA